MRAYLSIVAGAAIGTFGSIAQAADIPVPSGFAPYCSWVTPTSIWYNKWSFSTSGADPCGSVVDANIRAAGYYDTAGGNQAFGRCGNSLSSLNAVYAYKGTGASPVNAAVSAMQAGNWPYCELKVIPLQTPIFVSPFSRAPLPLSFSFHHTVFNFSVWGYHGAYYSLDVDSYGQQRFTAANPSLFNCHALPGDYSCVVDYKGHDLRWGANGRAYQYSNIEQAEDISLAEGVPLRAMGDGQVIATRFRDVPGICGSDPLQQTQGEIYILYRMGTGRYQEQFMSFYAHVRDWEDSSGTDRYPGEVVSAGDVVGHVGKTGCTSDGNGNPAAHLHYTVFRLSNVARTGTGAKPWRTGFNTTLDTYCQNIPGTTHTYCADNLVTPVDPFGWAAPAGVDPGGYLTHGAVLSQRGVNSGGTVPNVVGMGAASTNLWSDGGYPRPCDDRSFYWQQESSTGGVVFRQNPYRSCP